MRCNDARENASTRGAITNFIQRLNYGAGRKEKKGIGEIEGFFVLGSRAINLGVNANAATCLCNALDAINHVLNESSLIAISVARIVGKVGGCFYVYRKLLGR